MKHLTAAFLMLLTPVLAGCVGDDGGDGERPPAAALLCLEGVCNFQATVEPEERQANELSVAVNPLDPMNIIATGKDYNPLDAGDCVRDGVYVTKDGGLTWSNMNVPGSPWRLMSAPDTYEHHEDLSKYWCVTDPVVAFGPDGTAYWTIMPYQCDAVSGSKTGREFVPGSGVGLPQGGFNDWLWTCSSMYVYVSDDGGDTWSTLREVAFGPRLEHDKQWLTVAPNGNVLLCWDRASEVTAVDSAATQLTPQGVIVCSVSTDKGQSWTPYAGANPDWAGFLPWVDYGPDNRAHMAALDGSNVLYSSSDDGLAWSQPTTVGSYDDPPPGGEYGWPVVEGSDFRIFALPSLAVDRSDGPYSGSIYIAWFDHSTGDGEVVLTYSRDDGATWSEPTRVHDDPVDSGFDQFMPAVAVGPDGTVDIVWYDRRDDPDNHLFDLYYTYSLDGGETFAENLRVSEVSSDEQYSHHQNGMVFIGDYIDIDSTDGVAVPVWVDTRNEKADVFIAHIARPGTNER